MGITYDISLGTVLVGAVIGLCSAISFRRLLIRMDELAVENTEILTRLRDMSQAQLRNRDPIEDHSSVGLQDPR